MDNISRPYQSEVFILALQNVAKAQALQKDRKQSSQNVEDALQTSVHAEHLEIAKIADIFET